MMNDRALSTTIGYVLGLGIMLLLSTGLFITGGNFVDDQRDQAIRSELEVVGQQVANDVSRIDRVVQATSAAAEISTNQTVPPQVAGTTYDIRVRNGTTPHLLLSTNNPDISVRVNMTARTGLRNTTFDGGKLTVRLNTSAGTSGRLEVVDD